MTEYKNPTSKTPFQAPFGSGTIHPLAADSVRAEIEEATINGVTYKGYAFFYRWSDGLLHVGHEFVTRNRYIDGKQVEVQEPSSGYDRRHDLSAAREPYDERKNYEGNLITDAGRRKLTDSLEVIVNAWANTRDAKLLLVEAEFIAQNNRLHLVEQKFDEKRAVLDALGEELYEAVKQAAEAKERLDAWNAHEEELVDIAKGES